jgi:hypothetical protein
MLLKKSKVTKLPVGVYVITIILFILAAYFIFLGVSTWNKYYFNPPVMNSSQLEINSKLEAQGLPDLNQLIAWAGLFPALVLSLFITLVGVFLLYKKNWARWTTIVISLFVGLIGLLMTFGNWTNLPYAVIGLAMGIYLLSSRKVKSVFIFNKKRKKKGKQELRGLGGWLILIQISFISNALSYLFFILLFLLSSVYNTYPRIWILVLSILSIIALVLNLFVLFLMYTKRKSFPIYAEILLFYDVVITFIMFDILNSIINLILMGIIIYYLINSKRVKNTFIY